MGCGSSSAAEVAPAEIIEPSPSSDVPSDPQFPKSYRPSIISLQIPNEFGDDVSSDALSDRSDAQEENVDYLYATDVTLQWLLERIADKFKKTIPEDPQWIIERLNRPSWDLDYATSSVVRVTFGWDDDDLPRSVVLKTPVAKDQREDEEGKYHYIMFKRECNVYEWTQKFPKLVAPNIIHIKKHSKEGSGVVVMEDVSEKGQEQDPVKGLSLEVVRDLLKQIAYLHSVSLKHTSWSTLVADLPPSYYAHTIGNFDDTMTFFERQDVDHSRFVHIGKYFSDEYLHSTATETTELLEIPKVLVHGEPYASNVFTKMEGKEQRILSLIDWTEGHSGCFAEDVAKIICWNLNAKERVDNTSSLLEGYHFHLARYYDGDCPFTVDIIQRCYEVFVPFAMVSLCGKVMGLNNKTEKEPLIERAKSLIQQRKTLYCLLADLNLTSSTTTGCGSSSAAEVAPAEIIEPSPSSDVPSDPQFPKSYRPSFISLQIPNEFGDDVSSDALSDRSDAQEENVDYLYATDVTLQWLLERIADKFKKTIPEDPQWIIERLNRPSWDRDDRSDAQEENVDYLYATDVTLQWLLERIADEFKKTIPEDPQWIIERLNRPSWDLDYATSSVVRVTFGWDDDNLPRSVVLKTPVAKDQREDEEGKYHYIMFKRECNVYEWTQKFPKLVAPNIIHIKKHSKEGSGVVVMEDVSEKGQEQDPVKGLSLEVVRDLLKQIAYLHSVSLKHTSWSTLVADLPPSYYAHTIGNFDDTMTFFERQDVDHSRFVHIGKYFSDEYLHSTATETTELLEIPKVLVHGEPYASNVFTKMEGKEQRILSLIDWTEGHSGCFAEDVAKIICWNLNAKERVDNTSSLLEGYHFHLARYYDGDCPFTVDIIQRCYEVFVPFAMVSLCGKVMGLNNKTEKEPLIERAKSLIQQVYAMERLNET